MKNFYNITKGQIITLWIFGIWILFWAMDVDDRGSEWAGLIAIVTLAAIVFYTIGWRNRNKL